MSASASAEKTAEKKIAEEDKPQEEHHLGVLEEDDEFEEFPVAGGRTIFDFLDLVAYPTLS